jgi:N-methylhydantoinase A/oxoprolinase/acetone carboxylase beta subunit
MSKTFALVAALLTSAAFVTTAAPCLAQSATDELELVRVIIEAERKVVVAANMNLSDAESEAFWPVYNEYETAVRSVNDRRVKIITELAEKFETLTDEQATDLLEQSFKFKQERVKVRKSYMKKFGKVLSGKQLARFYQIDGKIDTMIDFDLARAIPLVN